MPLFRIDLRQLFQFVDRLITQCLDIVKSALKVGVTLLVDAIDVYHHTVNIGDRVWVVQFDILE